MHRKDTQVLCVSKKGGRRWVVLQTGLEMLLTVISEGEGGLGSKQQFAG